MVVFQNQMPYCTSPRYFAGRSGQQCHRSRKLSLLYKARVEEPALSPPILRLPVELLVMVMELCLADAGVVLPMVANMAPWSFTHVCSAWRQIALSTPQLWNNVAIDVQSYRCLRSTEAVFNRSNNLPLTLSISWLPLTGYWVDTILHGILGAYTTRTRLHRLKMTMDKGVFDVIQKHFKSRSPVFANLDDVHLSFITGSPPSPYEVRQPVDIQFLGSTGLKSLTVIAEDGLDNFTVRTSSVDTSALTHLVLLGVKETPAGALGILNASPQLTHFAFGLHSHLGGHSSSVHEGSTAEEVQHDNLRDLKVLVYGRQPGVGLGEFLRRLRTPALESVEVSVADPRYEGPMFHEGSRCAQFLHRSPMLDTIRLDGACVTKQ